jgi:hypothetical protein
VRAQITLLPVQYSLLTSVKGLTSLGSTPGSSRSNQAASLSGAESMRSAMSPGQYSFIKHQESGLSTKFLPQSRSAVSESDVSTSQLRCLSTTKLSHGASQSSSFGTTQTIPTRSLPPSSETVRQSSSTDSDRLNSRKSEKTDVPTIST